MLDKDSVALAPAFEVIYHRIQRDLCNKNSQFHAEKGNFIDEIPLFLMISSACLFGILYKLSFNSMCMYTNFFSLFYVCNSTHVIFSHISCEIVVHIIESIVCIQILTQ